MYPWTFKSSGACRNVLSYSVIEKANALLHYGIAVLNAESTTTVYLSSSKLERGLYQRAGVTIIPNSRAAYSSFFSTLSFTTE